MGRFPECEQSSKLSGNCLESPLASGPHLDCQELKVVPATGLEPVRCYSLEPESSASANSATRARELIASEQKISQPVCCLRLCTLQPLFAEAVFNLPTNQLIAS